MSTERNAVRAHVVDAITDIADNHASETWHHELHQVAGEAAANDMGSPSPSLDDYRRALRGGDMYEYENVAGLAVIDKLRDLIAESFDGKTDGPAHWLLMELLDLGDQGIRLMLGRHYLPNEDDASVFFDDEDDEDEVTESTPGPCWNGFCVNDCGPNGTEHVDATGVSFTQKPGDESYVITSEPNHGLDPMAFPAD